MVLRRADFLPAALSIIEARVPPGACLAGLKGLPKLGEIGVDDVGICDDALLFLTLLCPPQSPS